MAVQPTDLKIFKATSQEGGAISAVEAGGVDNLFEGGFSAQESDGGTVEYACAYIQNTSAQTAFNVSFYVSSKDTVGTVTLYVGSGASAIDTEEQTVGDVTEAPSNVTFTEAASVGEAISIGDLAAGSYKSIWFAFTLPAGTSAADFDYEITIDAETGA